MATPCPQAEVVAVIVAGLLGEELGWLRFAGRATGQGFLLFWEQSSAGMEHRLTNSTAVCTSVLHPFKSSYFFYCMLLEVCIAVSSSVKNLASSDTLP